MNHIVIVESPAKCKTINKYLGPEYTVLASFGHIRDLPSKDGSVLPDENFAMHYEVNSESKKHVETISKAVKGADSLILATDPDREGEAISWHVLETLKGSKALKKETKVQRVAFNSITRKAVQEAMENPRELDINLVNAQQARRALDYLVGFNLSPVLWRKLPGSKSAGRVQSVALRLICERENEVELFETQEYWTITGNFLSKEDKVYSATLSHIEGEKLEKFAITNEQKANATAEILATKQYKIVKVEKKQLVRKPYAPYTTSSLQQDAAIKLGFGAKRTMMAAQQLYEGVAIAGGDTTGLITYMRTDGVTVTPDAVNATRDVIKDKYGELYLPEKPHFYKSKAKNAQEAHEAIRPTDPTRTPEQVKQFLNTDQLNLYRLIWDRLISSQMKSLVLDQVIAEIESTDGYARFHAVGSTVNFDGFTKVYKEQHEDKSDKKNGDKTLPPLNENDSTDLKEADPEQHFTQPPPRYGEAGLVKKLEELGIGRPSTYASIISVLQDRNYVKLEKKKFVPELMGRLVTVFLSNFFRQYVEYDFTAKLESELDQIAAGELEWRQELRNFWEPFSQHVDEAMNVEFSEVLEKLDLQLEGAIFHGEESIEEQRKCPTCSTGRLGLKLGKFGPFLGCSQYPECSHTRQLSDAAHEEEGGGDILDADGGPKVLGIDDATGMEVSLRKGPYGFYIQLGEAVEKEKPRRSTLPRNISPESVDLQIALGLLSLPRVIDNHPETGKEITAAIGKYGPYIKHDNKFVSLKDSDNVLTIGINRAVDLIATDKKKKGGEPARELGNHPESGEPVGVYEGRYGPYVKHQKLNASLKKEQSVDTVTLDEAVELLNKQAEKKAEKKKSKKG